MPLIRSASFNLLSEILVRVALVTTFCYMESMNPFVRVIQPSELASDLRYPRHESYVPGGALWAIVLSVPCVLSFLAWAVCNDCNDALEILLAWSLTLGLTGCLTNLMKLVVGRPRPDFFYRCFPDGVATADLQCTGDSAEVMEGRKSFPSGHSSHVLGMPVLGLLVYSCYLRSFRSQWPSVLQMAFCSLGTSSLWLCGRLEALGRRRGASARLVTSLTPLVLALCVALSRTCDYHHHWQDVLVGSLLGYGIAVLSYRQYYNPLTSELSGMPYVVSNLTTAKYANGKPDTSPSKNDLKEHGMESTPLLNNGLKKEDKWI